MYFLKLKTAVLVPAALHLSCILPASQHGVNDYYQMFWNQKNVKAFLFSVFLLHITTILVKTMYFLTFKTARYTI